MNTMIIIIALLAFTTTLFLSLSFKKKEITKEGDLQSEYKKRKKDNNEIVDIIECQNELESFQVNSALLFREKLIEETKRKVVDADKHIRDFDELFDKIEEISTRLDYVFKIEFIEELRKTIKNKKESLIYFYKTKEGLKITEKQENNVILKKILKTKENKKKIENIKLKINKRQIKENIYKLSDKEIAKITNKI